MDFRGDFDELLKRIQQDGFAILPGILSARRVDAILLALDRVWQSHPDGVMHSQSGSVFGARNLLQMWPEVAQVWKQPPLPALLADILGPDFGLVRVLYFDKPPEQTWALPWHKDMTIAVRDNSLPSPHFAKPTRKAGVPHVEASREVLEQMITARIHLDDVTVQNGPLKVLPGSHLSGTTMELGTIHPQDILVQRGDVLLIRPLVAHCSNRSHPDTTHHRRILHLEFASLRDLPDGYAWHDFRSLEPDAQARDSE
jgi:hypothetical protein